MAPELVRVFYGPPNHPGLEFFFIGFGPGLIFGHSARRLANLWCHQREGDLRKHAIARRVAGVRQYAPERPWFFRPFLAEPITDGGVRRCGMFALVCSYVREQLAQPLVGPFSRRTGIRKKYVGQMA